ADAKHLVLLRARAASGHAAAPPSSVMNARRFTQSPGGDRRDVADEIEVELVIEHGVHRVRRMDQEERIAIRGRAHDGLSGDITPGAGAVLDEDGLAEPL